MKLYAHAPDEGDELVVFFFVRTADLSFGLLSDEDDLLLPPAVFFPPLGDADDGRKVRPTLLPLLLVLCWEVNTTQWGLQ